MKIIGAVDPRLPVTAVEFEGTTSTPALVAAGKNYKVYAVRWPVMEGVTAEGLLLEPNQAPMTRIVAIPDADWSPEMLAGLAAAVVPIPAEDAETSEAIALTLGLPELDTGG